MAPPHGRRGWIIGLGHRQPLNYPFELRYGREEGKRLARPAAIKLRVRSAPLAPIPPVATRESRWYLVLRAPVGLAWPCEAVIG